MAESSGAVPHRQHLHAAALRLATLAERASCMLRARWQLRHAELGARVWTRGTVLLAPESGRVRLGRSCFFLGGPVATELRSHPGATLRIGDRCGFNYGVTIDAHDEVTLGNGCILATGVVIRDRTRRLRGPVHIGDDVWLAHGAVVQPGVRIGDGAVVSARAVVTRDVPPHSLAIGNPARCMRLDLVAREDA
ncbi:MAG: acyltransferase [Pseudomonadota bacterium]